MNARDRHTTIDQVRILLVGASLICASCQTGWKKVSAEEGFRAMALKRARFELSCPDAEVTIAALNSKGCLMREDGVYVCAGAQVGVEGCDSKTTFVFPPLGGGDDWIRNSEVLKSEASTNSSP